MTTDDDILCTLCNTPKSEHASKMHKFVGPGEDTADAGITNDPKKRSGAAGSTPAGKTPTVVAQGLGGDPVLRLALINAGVIDLAHIIAAEQQIAAAAASGRPAFAQAAEAGHPEDRPPHA